MATKKEIRTQILAKRDSMKESERMRKSGQIFSKLKLQSYYYDAEIVLCYVSYQSEVDTFEFIERCISDGKQLYCPKVIGSQMEFYQISSLADLRVGFHGIWEPLADETKRFIWNDKNTLIVMPGAVFDEKNHRIGYGGGYYDKFLSNLNKSLGKKTDKDNNKEKDKNDNNTPWLHTVAVAFSQQIVPVIPAEDYDICPEIILTEERELNGISIS